MRIAYLDCFSGISGDMFLGALLDVGVPSTLLEHTVSALGLGAHLETSRVDRSGISAIKVDVISPDASARTAVRHSRAHPHHHISHETPGAAPPARDLKEIREIIAQAAIAELAKRNALAMFEKLAAAESKIHNVPVERVHFHEVGAVDSIVDMVCAAVGREALAADELICSPLNVGGGTITCSHGSFPVPAPATIELLKGVPAYSSGIAEELVTPTGAAIVGCLASRFGGFPRMKIESAGYGAGAHDWPGHPNVLRMVLGEPLAELGKAGEEAVMVLECNLDDLSPQVFGYVMDRLFEAGALDVFATPVQMKKNRPATLLSVLARPEDAARLAELIFAETTTLGVRRREERRQVLSRQFVAVSTRFGEVRIKIASLNGTTTSYGAEYEDCRRIAREQRVPLKIVIEEAVQEYLRSTKTK
ncbi:MAG: nickel pincer cofactor biosynthesis protein LarC [Acidobacteria bacterium]|nr:nickel pincer cofactor biosynthesis protein LarC [Acidobacteriota bacterium]